MQGSLPPTPRAETPDGAGAPAAPVEGREALEARVDLKGRSLRGHGFAMARHAARAVAPSVPAVAAVLVARFLEGGDPSAGYAIVELVLCVVATVVATYALECDLLREAVGYLQGRKPLTVG